MGTQARNSLCKVSQSFILMFHFFKFIFLLSYYFRVHLMPEYQKYWALRASCNPSFLTDSEESKLMYLVLERSTSKSVFSHCTCTVGLRGDCSHIGALMFMLCDVVAEGQQQLPPDPTCTDLPCSWSNPKDTSIPRSLSRWTPGQEGGH